MSWRLSSLVVIVVAAGCAPGSLYDGPIILDDGGVSLCETEKAPNGDGHHNAGMACMASGCHRGGTAPTFTAAGTLYLGRDGNEVVGGATIVIVDGDGVEEKVVTASNGNFWTSAPLATPLLIRASQCPMDTPMISLSQSGDCNIGGCHGSAGDRASLDF